MRRTKIVATLGPATDDLEVLDGIIQAGVDVVRVNFSHGDPDDHRKRVQALREQAALHKRCIGVLGDLQGPKIRTERFKDGSIMLNEGDAFCLDAAMGREDGNQNAVGVTYKTLPQEVSEGNVLILDDGRIVLQVTSVEGEKIHTEVVVGGPLSNNKGINLRGGGLSAPAITEKDRQDILLAAELDVDFLAVSFPRCADDMREARRLLSEAGGDAKLVAKIERAEALVEIDAILEESDVIMVARGDLGVEIGDPELPATQKKLINQARAANKAVITATQMMESMRSAPIPTRAEVFDVANAVIDGTDAVMLSAETATGEYPVRAVQSMSRICEHAEQDRHATTSRHRIDQTFEQVDESIAMATMYVANHLHVKAIGALTESGDTPRWMSRISSAIPIYALTRHLKTRRMVTVYRGVYPVPTDGKVSTAKDVNKAVVSVMKGHQIVEDDDSVIITRGEEMGVGGGTNTMKIIRVGDWS